jgi:cytochrome c55X
VRKFIAFSCLGAVLAMALLPMASQAEPAPARRAELLNLVVQDCGSCHGLRMEGGLGLPLTPKALEGKDRDGLAITIMQGRPGTTMPPWNPFITEAEAGWIVDMLQKGLPNAH